MMIIAPAISSLIFDWVSTLSVESVSFSLSLSLSLSLLQLSMDPEKRKGKQKKKQNTVSLCVINVDV